MLWSPDQKIFPRAQNGMALMASQFRLIPGGAHITTVHLAKTIRAAMTFGRPAPTVRQEQRMTSAIGESIASDNNRPRRCVARPREVIQRFL